MEGIFMSVRDIKESMDGNGIVSGVVCVAVWELVDNTFEEVLAIMSHRLIGSALGMSIDYKVILLEKDTQNLLVAVSLDPCRFLEEEGEGDEE